MSVVKEEAYITFCKSHDGNWSARELFYGGYQACLAQVNEVKHECNEKSQEQQPTDLSKQLREYAADSGYSHNDYADTMLAAASEIERCTERVSYLERVLNYYKNMVGA